MTADISMSLAGNFWIAVFVMMVLTYLTRALPFLLPENIPLLRRLADKDSRFSALGPSLIAAIAGKIVVSDILKAVQGGHGLIDLSIYALGLAATLLALRLVRNAGFAVIAGMVVYGLAHSAMFAFN